MIRARLAIALLSAGCGLVSAAEFQVTKTDDTLDGACDHDCSLREAVRAANELPGVDTIRIPSGVYLLTIAGAGENRSSTGDLDVNDDATFIGAGRGETIIDGNQLDRVFHLVNLTGPDPTVAFGNLTIRNGMVDGCGGGVCAEGDISLTNVDLVSNRATNGGALCNFDTATLIGVGMDGNAADLWGGAVDNGYATLLLTDSTLSNNTTAGEGGAICNDFGVLEVVNSTFSGNSAAFGGALWNRGEATMRSTTVFDNASVAGSFSVFDAGGELRLRTSIVANGDAGEDCSDAAGVVSDGSNLESGISCGLSGVADQQGVNPLLGDLLNNGGATLTHAPLFGSPAIDTVTGDCPATDQRGLARPVDGDGNDVTACDIGAVEVQASSRIVAVYSDEAAVVRDINGNGADDIALMRPLANGATGAEIRDSMTGERLAQVDFLNSSFDSLQILGFADPANGSASARSPSAGASAENAAFLAVLALSTDASMIVVQVRDAITGDRRGNIFFLGAAFTPVRMVVIPDIDGNGAAEIAVLATRNSDGAILVQVRDGMTGARLQNAYFLGPAFQPLDLIAIPDTDGNGVPELGLLAVKPADGRFLVQLRNAVGDPRPRNLFFLGPDFEPVSVLFVPDSDGNGIAEISVLAAKSADDRIVVQSRNLNGAPSPANTFYLGAGHTPLGQVAFDGDGNGVPEVAVLAARNADGRIVTESRNLSGARATRTLFYMDSGFVPDALLYFSDRDGNATGDLGVLATRTSDQRRRMQFKNVSGPPASFDIWFAP